MKAYEAPTLTWLGRLEERTLGEGTGFPDTCEFAVGPNITTDPCKGQMGKTPA